MTETTPLKALIAKYVTIDIVNAIAREHQGGRVFFVIFQTRQFVNYIPNLRNTHMKNENNFENEQTYFFGKEKYWVGEGAASNEKRNQK